MVGWKTDSGRKGFGTSMHTFTLETVTGEYLHEDIRKSSPGRIDEW